ncbi:putative succinate-semialdehyde dehydrogenase [Glarea lozoyensis 74030]|uniref:Putative succinate-semialdehyde dehydrogenase n=1 Tax=Glarea lozoyensis (strain ATCC 74030 / MF5533) TaxID=1104152 RepID=H0EE67_GLAL7|nr:putative succinate-semialdehyde dehydrogenase [Glarea lozoyensis 74030]
MTSKLPFELKNSGLFKEKSYVNGNWVESKSGKRFDVIDPGSGKVWASAPDNNADDVDVAVKAAYVAFESYKKTTPKSRAQLLLRWDALIRENRDDIANIVTYETGKPLAESQGELDYALGFTWWFAGEAERVTGTIQTPSVPGRRILTVKQPVGVVAALVPWNFPIAETLTRNTTFRISPRKSGRTSWIPERCLQCPDNESGKYATIE